MSTMIDLTDQRFGRLTVIERDENYVSPSGRRAAHWICECDCGTRITIIGAALREGVTRSCGCLAREESRKRVIQQFTTHGKRHTRLYEIWKAMKSRCNNPNSSNYKYYGGRGIKVCDEWMNDFQKFWDWAMANGYRDDLSIDRIDNDKGYSPDNCRWDTAKRQRNNRRNNRVFTVDGETKTLAEWCEIYEKSYCTSSARLRRGWTIEEALDLVQRKK